MQSDAISHDVEGLERDLAELRAQVEQDSSTFATLEQQVAELRQNLLRTRESVTEREARLSEKRKELAEAKRLEGLAAYKEDLSSQRAAADRATGAAAEFLSALNSYDEETISLRRLLEEMRTAFGTDDRVGEVETVLDDEPPRMRATWEAVIGATKWRLDALADDANATGEKLAEDLQDIAQERRRSLIKAYFGKSSSS
jgi:chromosome segregation ATPase